jgi:putative RNA 2'-phosphotransferase
MTENQKKRISKFLSLVLRHQPETIDLVLDANGWADVEELIAKWTKHSHIFSADELKEIVFTNDKKRFSFNEDETKIRANQGHSIDVDLALKATEPPEFLYHGTVAKFLENIKQEGLLKISRQHVHLSGDKETAEKVGSRRGTPVILVVNSFKMHQDGYAFFISENGVWLTDNVPVKYIEFR